MTRAHWWQLVALLVVGLTALTYVGLRYARLDRYAGGTYTVHADFADSGGIFVNAEVTYQGVPVGRVGALRLRPGGVRVELELDTDNPRVPASAQAVVANRSAIGEQFVDLRPASVGEPYLAEGSVISNTTIPVPIQDVLASAVEFTDSVPIDDLHTVITELGKAFNGNGENLRVLVDSLANLAKAGKDNLSQTISLIRNGNTVLETQAQQSDAILDWSKNLDSITAQLATSDPDLRRLLTTGQTSATEISTLIARSGTDVTTVLRNLAADVRNVQGTFFAAGPALAMLSSISAGSYSTASGDGVLRFGTQLETNNPPSCTVGYDSMEDVIARERRKNPNFDINYDDYPFNRNAGCKVPHGNPTSVRGAQNATYDDPRIPQPWDRKPKKDPDKLNLNPIAQQLSTLLGVSPR
ncbi:mammalian cell entry protein [Williamsia sp. Leaf354]|uniref:MCE family protein n=1 Tax=Williamsia sp. Leaf354 TaxID=1736349 RepID=UPI0006FF0DCA|nr:MCE family protein [Williamsia sp. Leaf354]KQS00534.1 mammalian cell entry protein [Williamsia sp. Leaf354]